MTSATPTSLRTYPGPLRPLQQSGHRAGHLLGNRRDRLVRANTHLGQRVHKVEFGGRATDHGGEEVEEGRPRIRRRGVLAGVGGDPPESRVGKGSLMEPVAR